MDELLKDYDRSARVFRPTANAGFPYTSEENKTKKSRSKLVDSREVQTCLLLQILNILIRTQFWKKIFRCSVVYLFSLCKLTTSLLNYDKTKTIPLLILVLQPRNQYVAEKQHELILDSYYSTVWFYQLSLALKIYSPAEMKGNQYNWFVNHRVTKPRP